MKHFSVLIVFLAIVQCSFSAHSSKKSGSFETTTEASTTAHPSSVKLQQLLQMKESALLGWYDMVKKFLVLIKPDQKTLDYIIDITYGKHELNPQETVFEIAKMNYAFLTMIVIGIIYICVMLITGVFFSFCRLCGRCGAKNSQRQRRSDNCWRTMHKFCLILMIAFLVVPITCMCIINEHMQQSSPAVKGNATEVFNILIKFANDTDSDIDQAFEKSNKSPIQNFDTFKSTFVELVHENISSSIDHEKLEEIKNIVKWAMSVEDQHTAIANASSLSKAVKNLKSRIASIREQTESLHNCTNSQKKICNLDLKQLPLEKINVDEAYAHVQREFAKLLKTNFEELTNVIDQIQNNTILKNKIEEESESLKQFVEDAEPRDEDIKKVKNKVKQYTDQLRSLAYEGKRELEKAFEESDGYEKYRWWAMFAIAAILLVPVAFLSLGLICGCCGYEKERHPTKRSTSSNCGGLCLILAVYIFFLISSVLMVVTMFLFVIGGNCQTFVCIPLFQKDFEVLDQMKEKLTSYNNDSIFKDMKPSKLLKDCNANKGIIVALGLNTSDPGKFLSKIDSGNSDEIDEKLKKALLEITSEIREKLHQFTNDLNLKEMKDLPQKLQESLRSSKANISAFINDIKPALAEDTNEDVSESLQFVDASAADLFREVDEFEKKLDNFSTTLLNIYSEAENYKAKIREIEENLNDVEERLPKVIKTHLFQAVASSSGLTDKMENVGKCYPFWLAFDIARTAICEFVVDPINGFWFGLGWALIFIIPTIFFSVKLSRYYLRMKYDDDPYIHDSGEAIPLEEFNQHQNYMVHPTANNQARQFHYK
ncbi:prominin-1-like isoform X2 [Stegodyphus dumicola]|uniref:prominin-1-like isoform X2 n=1 Tax=Stegodyphus dumicola TaxID=202533 RepID=UPI0015ADE957|nr:prominin-1-like isoform X2 [Stegodyphus dumicola]